MRTRILLIAAFFALAIQARADYAVLRSGQRLHITGYEREGDTVRLSVAGGLVQVPAAEVVAIEPEDFFPAPVPVPAAGPFGGLIRAAAKKHGVDEELLSSVVAAESNYNPRAVSRRQALGLMQLMPATAARLSVSNVFDPSQNLEGGTRYLKQLLEQYHGDLGLALAAYNSGPGNIEKYRGVPPFPETRSYMRRVKNTLEQRRKKKPVERTACGRFPVPCSQAVPSRSSN